MIHVRRAGPSPLVWQGPVPNCFLKSRPLAPALTRLFSPFRSSPALCWTLILWTCSIAAIVLSPVSGTALRRRSFQTTVVEVRSNCTERPRLLLCVRGFRGPEKSIPGSRCGRRRNKTQKATDEQHQIGARDGGKGSRYMKAGWVVMVGGLLRPIRFYCIDMGKCLIVYSICHKTSRYDIQCCTSNS